MGRKRAAVTTNTERTTLRLPEDIHEEISRIADANERSVNAEIILRLRYTMDGFDLVPTKPLLEYLNEQFSALREELAQARERLQKLEKK